MVGRTLAHCRILARAGAGAMGEVYRAEDQRLKRTVALVHRDFGQKRWFEHDPDLDSLRSHPRFIELLASID